MPKFISRSGQFPAVAGSSAGFIERGGRESSRAAKSTIDRVLILAAIVCAAGLVWQLSVLLMGHGAAAHKAELAAAAKSDPTSPAAPSAAKSDPASVRVVYPAESDAGAPKTTVKAVDTPVAPAPAPSPFGSAPAPATTAASAPAPAAQSPASTMAPPSGAAQSASLDPAPAAPRAAAAPAAPSSPPAPQASFGAPSPAASADAAPPPAAQDAATAQAPAPAPGKPKPAASGQTLNINNASIEALNHLPGGGHIGSAIASHRPYRSVADLVKKRVLRREVFDQIKGQIATE